MLRFLIIAAMAIASNVALAQGVSRLELASTVLAVASWSPQRLVDDPPSTGSSPQERALFPDMTTCFRHIRAQFQARVPGLIALQDQINREMQQNGLGGSGGAGAVDEVNWIRILTIADDALNRPEGLASSPGFVMQKRAIDTLQMLVGTLIAQNPGVAQALKAQIDQIFPQIKAASKQLVAFSCGWSD